MNATGKRNEIIKTIPVQKRAKVVIANRQRVKETRNGTLKWALIIPAAIVALRHLLDGMGVTFTDDNWSMIFDGIEVLLGAAGITWLKTRDTELRHLKHAAEAIKNGGST